MKQTRISKRAKARVGGGTGQLADDPRDPDVVRAKALGGGRSGSVATTFRRAA